eukprot:scaffold14417_cov133-Skeletonema_marinoi.AAC.1
MPQRCKGLASVGISIKNRLQQDSYTIRGPFLSSCQPCRPKSQPVTWTPGPGRFRIFPIERSPIYFISPKQARRWRSAVEFTRNTTHYIFECSDHIMNFIQDDHNNHTRRSRHPQSRQFSAAATITASPSTTRS